MLPLARNLALAGILGAALPATASGQSEAPAEETVTAQPAPAPGPEKPAAPAEATEAGAEKAEAGAEGEEVPEDRSPIDAVKGHIGIGYFTDFAPLGARIWFTRDIALDVGVDGSFSSGNLQGYQVGVDVGLVYAIAHYHYAVAIARLGAGWRVNELTGEHGGGARHDVIANGFVGVELFLGAFGFPNVSLQGGYGVQAAWLVEGGTNFVIGATDPSLDVTSSGSVGFHIYL